MKVKLLKVVKTPPTSNQKYIAEFELLKEDGKPKVSNTKKKIKKVGFGAKGYRDFTLMNQKGNKHYIADKRKRDEVKASYRKRHEKDLLTKNPLRAGYLSYYLLWNKSTLGASIADYKKKFRA